MGPATPPAFTSLPVQPKGGHVQRSPEKGPHIDVRMMGEDGAPHALTSLSFVGALLLGMGKQIWRVPLGCLGRTHQERLIK